MSDVNEPAIVEEVTRLHDAYDRALVANDIAALTEFFWNSPHIVRYGVSEQLYGADAIAAYRQGAVPIFTDRRMIHRTVLTFGRDFASIMSEYTQLVFGQSRHNRQSQVWARLPGLGWKIVSAHVSNQLSPPAAASWDAYVDQTSAALGLKIDPANRAAVIQHVQRASLIAAPLLAVSLPPDAEIAPVFTP